MALLAHRLEAVRRSQFVGRTAERQLFRSALTSSRLPFHVLFVYGPGGVGKTMLLRAYQRVAEQARAATALLDGRRLEPSPDFFIAALQQALGLDAAQAPLAHLSRQKRRCVIFIDTYEKLAPLDGWLRDDFLPRLPASVLVVLAGRQPPALEWRTDPGWQHIMRPLALRNFTPTEQQTYLTKRQIPRHQHAAVLDTTYGHPLALALVADVYKQRPGTEFSLDAAPDVIRALVQRFVQHVPSPMHRAALEAGALVRVTTEPLLAAMLDLPGPSAQADGDGVAGNPPDAQSAREAFDWLHGLSFVEPERHGLSLQDLARQALAADLRWRNPKAYAELHRRARTYYMAQLSRADRQAQSQVLFDYIYLHRDNPMVKPFFEWQESGTVYTDHPRPDDTPHLLAMTEQHEGAAARRLAEHWLARQPEGFSVFRSTAGEPAGYLAAVAVHATTEADRAADPALAAAWQCLQGQAPLRPGEVATYFRFWMAGDTYQAVSPTQSRIFLNIVQHYLTTPGLAFTFLACADPDFWRPVFAYADLARLEGADFEVGGRRFGVYGHDWRAVPPMAWLTLLGERETVHEPGALPPPPVAPLMVLSQADFAEAVRQALRHFANPAALRANPLLKSRLVVDQAGPDSAPDARAAVLRQLLHDTAAALKKSPRQAKFFAALHHTYFQPAVTQEQAAEQLDVPFSTYRRHLQSGLTYITERLWATELGNLAPTAAT